MAEGKEDTGFDFGGPLSRLRRAGSGVLGNIAGGMAEKRGTMNDFRSEIAMEKNLDTNRRLGDALARNRALNMQQNLGELMKRMEAQGGLRGYGQGGMQAADFNRGLAQAYLQSATSGINPMLQKEMGNIAGIPGLTVEGKQVAPDVEPELKGPGFGEVALGGLASFFGG
jgi:hypothetical protein